MLYVCPNQHSVFMNVCSFGYNFKNLTSNFFFILLSILRLIFIKIELTPLVGVDSLNVFFVKTIVEMTIIIKDSCSHCRSSTTSNSNLGLTSSFDPTEHHHFSKAPVPEIILDKLVPIWQSRSGFLRRQANLDVQCVAPVFISP